MKTKKKSLFAWFGRTVAVGLVPLMLFGCANNNSDDDDNQNVINQNPPTFSTDPAANDTITGTSYIKVSFSEAVSGVKADDSVVLKNASGIPVSLTQTSKDGTTYTFDPSGDLTSGVYYLYVGYGGDIVDGDSSAALPGTIVFNIDDAKVTTVASLTTALGTATDATAIISAVKTAIASTTNDLLSVMPVAIEAALTNATSSSASTIINGIMSAANGAASLTSTPSREISARINDMANFTTLLDRISAKLIGLAENATITVAEFQAAVDAVQNSLDEAGAEDDQGTTLLASFDSSVQTDVSGSTKLTQAYIDAANTETSGGVISQNIVTLTTSADVPTMTSQNEEIKGVFGAASGNTYGAGDFLTAGAGTDTMTLTASGTTAAEAVTVQGVEIINIKDTVGTTYNALLVEDTPTISFTNTVDGQTSTVTNARIAATYGLTGKGNLTVTYSAAEVTGDSTGKVNLSTVGTSASNRSTIDVSSSNTVENLEIVATGANYLDLTAGNTTDNITVTGAGSMTIGTLAAAADVQYDASAATGAQTLTMTNLTLGDIVRAGSATTDKLTFSQAAVTALPTISGFETIEIDFTGVGNFNASSTTGVTTLEIDTIDNTSATASAVTNLPSSVTTINITDADDDGGSDNVSVSYASSSTGSLTVNLGDSDSSASTTLGMSIGDVAISGLSGAYTINSIGETDNDIDVLSVPTATSLTINSSVVGLVQAGAITATKATSIALNASADLLTVGTITSDEAVTASLSASGAEARDLTVAGLDLDHLTSLSVTADDGADVAITVIHFDDLAKDGTTDASVSMTLTATHADSTITITDIKSASNVTTATIDTLTVAGAGDVILNDGATDLGDNSTEVSLVDATGLTGFLDFDCTDCTVANTVRLGNAASGHTNLIVTGTGGDIVTGGSGMDNMTTGAGNDVITAGGGVDGITPGAGQDTITLTETTSAVDTIHIFDGGSANVDTVAGFTLGTDVLSLDTTTTFTVNDTQGGTTTTEARSIMDSDNLSISAFAAGGGTVTSHTTNSATTGSATTIYLVDNTTESSFANALGTATGSYVKNNNAGTDNSTGGANLFVWYDAGNSQAVYGYTIDDNTTSSSTFYEIIRVNTSASSFTATNVDASLATQ